MIKFGTHQILSFQLFKALWDAYNTGKWYSRNYTTGNCRDIRGETSVIGKLSIDPRSLDLWSFALVT